MSSAKFTQGINQIGGLMPDLIMCDITFLNIESPCLSEFFANPGQWGIKLEV